MHRSKRFYGEAYILRFSNPENIWGLFIHQQVSPFGVPQVIFINPNPGGAHSFVIFAFFLGLAYAFVVWKQQSIFWVTVAHALLISAVLAPGFILNKM